MLSFSRSRIVPLVWLLVPTLLWSLSFRSLILCVDPLLFPAFERRVAPKFVFLVRVLWVALFALTLLWAWNIGPGSYSFYLHEALPYTPKPILVPLGIAVLLFVWFSLTPNIAQRMGSWRVWVVFAGVILFALKALAGSGSIYAPTIRQHIKSPILGTARMLFAFAKVSRNHVVAGTPDKTFYAFVKRDDVLPRRVVLMLVESWGETQGTLGTIASDIRSRNFQSVEYGFASYRGSTLSGEFRELCSIYVQPSDSSMTEIAHLKCAPKYFYEKNYQVIGIHGYQSSFYARSLFWARFGIKNQMFGDRFKTKPQCPGPFPGVCDENLIRKSIDMLDEAANPTFVYILTLSSHEPMDPAALDRRGKYFNEVQVQHSTQIVTRRAISAMVERLEERRSSECTLVYIAGDHQPPSASAQGNIFELGKVPYLAFTQNCSGN